MVAFTFPKILEPTYALHLWTLKSFLLGSQYNPHSSGLVGTNLKYLQLQVLQLVYIFYN